MGFFGNIFGKGKAKEATVSIGEAAAFFEKELAPKKKAVLDESAKKLAEIKHVLREARDSLEKLETASLSATIGKKGNRLDKIVGTAKGNAQRQLASLFEKLEPKNTSDLQEIKQYCEESLDALQQAGSFWKNVAYTKISFKDEMKLVGEKLKLLSKSFVALKDVFEKNDALFLSKELEEKIGKRVALEEKVVGLETEVSLLQKKTEELIAEKTRLQTELKNLEEGEEFKGIGSLNEKKAELLKEKQTTKTEVIDMFAKVEKPLHRLDKAVKARKLFLPREQEILLNELLLNPFRALKRDPKAETLKQILLEAKKGIESGLIDLKEKEKEKKLAVLSELVSFDFFGETFWKFNGLDSDIMSIEKQLNELPAIAEESRLLGLLAQVEAKAEETKATLDLRAKEVREGNNSLKELDLEIKKVLSEATGKIVSIKG